MTPRFALSRESAVRSAPRHCPVCGEELILTRLGCPSCGTELSGTFEACEFCTLSPEDREVLRVFLVSRGNMKDLERHLGVSYPTARSRFDALLGRLGLAASGGAGPSVSGEDLSQAKAAASDRLEVLRRLARGEIDLVRAEAALEGREAPRHAEESSPGSESATEAVP